MVQMGSWLDAMKLTHDSTNLTRQSNLFKKGSSILGSKILCILNNTIPPFTTHFPVFLPVGDVLPLILLMVFTWTQSHRLFSDILAEIIRRECFHLPESSFHGCNISFQAEGDRMQDSLNHSPRWLTVLFNQRTHWPPWRKDSLIRFYSSPSGLAFASPRKAFSLSLAFIYSVYIYISKPLSSFIQLWSSNYTAIKPMVHKAKMQCFLGCRTLSIVRPSLI